MSALSAYDAIKAGKDPERVIATGTAQVGTTAVVGTAGTALAAGGYVTGTVATGGTLVVATALSAGVGYVVDNHYEEIKDGIYDAGEYYRDNPPKMTR